MVRLSILLLAIGAFFIFRSLALPPVVRVALPVSPQPTQKDLPVDKQIQVEKVGGEAWGVARKIDEGTYTIKVGNDANMTSPKELLDALNAYRSVNNGSQLTWDDKLAGYAQSRANTFQQLGTTDKHAGFNAYLENDVGFSELGFRRLGENSYFGGKLNGVHLIEWVFAKSPGHDANQRDSNWSHVGIGVTDVSVDLIFGGEKI